MEKHSNREIRTTLFLALLAIVLFSTNPLYGQAIEGQAIGINIKSSLLIPGETLLGDSKNTINFSVGFVYSRPLIPKLTFVTGLYYSPISFTQKDYSPLWGSDHDGFGGVNQEASWKEDKYLSHYVSVPLELNYQLTNGKNNLFVKVGYELMINVANDLQSVHFVGGIRSTETNEFDFNNNNLSKIKAGLGYSIKVKDSFRIILEPEFEYYVFNIYKDLPLYSNRPVSFGINAKIMFGMDKGRGSNKT